jgi:AhpD family alkylhydroperoxidase
VDLVYLRVSQINKWAYCLDKRTRDLLKKEQTIEKLALVQAWAEAGNLLTSVSVPSITWSRP